MLEVLKNVKKLPDYAPFLGVCSGLAYAFGLPVWILRLAVVLLLIAGPGFLIYPLLWLVMPSGETPVDYNAVTGDSRAPF